MTTVELVDSQLRIDGVPRTLLCASLFPFRVPREQWRERLAAVKALGYHCVDVYIPWNYHETAPGQFDFSGQRDVGHFLDLAQKIGLFVLARPGPYICSEWDGGGLPAWLSLDPDLRLRQFEPRYLDSVESWFSRVLPIIAGRQAGVGGPVVLVQLENELDFFDCDDPGAYVGWLRDSAVGHGITVPLVACSGQGDIARAGGAVDGVAPAVNLYPSDESDEVEALVEYYESALRSQGMPLLVTETNRLHRTLKRLVGGGVRLLGPYLQASGWNFGYGTAVNNWGDLLGLMTHDYDFGGAIAPDGTARADAEEGRWLARLIDALGPRLAAGVPAGPPVDVDAVQSLSTSCLSLERGGQLLSLTNLHGEPADVVIRSGAAAITHRVAASTCELLVRDLPLASVGIDGELVLSSAEISALAPGVLEVHARDRSVLVLRLRGASVATDSVVESGDLVTRTDGELLVVEGSSGVLRLVTGGTDLAVRFVGGDAHPEPLHEESVDVVSVVTSDGSPDRGVAWTTVASDLDSPAPLERFGVYSGSARYLARTDLTGVCELVIAGAADIVEVRVDDRAGSWRANPGTDMLVPVAGAHGVSEIDVRVQVWGHSNFDDPRLPSLRLGSLRGITGALAVVSHHTIAEGWTLRPRHAAPAIGDAPPPRSNWGGWMTGASPQTITYERPLVVPPGITAAALHVNGSAAVHVVSLGGRRVGTITPLSPTLYLGAVAEGDILTVATTRAWGEPTGEPRLLLGREVRGWQVVSSGMEEMVRAAARSEPAHVAHLPLTIASGEARWIEVDLGAVDPARDVILRMRGERVMLTVVCGSDVLGRLWSEQPDGARLKGGRGDVMLVPGPWAVATGSVRVLVESTAASGGTLSALSLGGSIDA